MLRGLLATVLLTGATARAQETYVALGDSLAFGFRTLFTTDRSFGDQGYVAPFADFLAPRTSDGARPRVLNLAVPGETSASFFSGGQLGAFFNLNYDVLQGEAQWTKLDEAIGDAATSGRPISWVTLHLGANDLFDVTDAPGFFDLAPADQQALFDAAIADLCARHRVILDRLRADLPDARAAVMGYYNPYAVVPDDPLHPLAESIVRQLNDELRAVSRDAGVRFVEVYEAFVGNEAEWTLIVSDGDIHPTDEGYRQLGRLLVEEVACPADLAAPWWALDFFDVSEFIARFGRGDAGADFNDDGVLNFFDVSAYLSAFAAGCD